MFNNFNVCKLIVLFFLCGVTSAVADNLKEFKTCSTYERFLTEEQITYTSTGCDKITEFLLDNAKLDRARTVLAYEKFATPNSSFHTLASGLKSLIIGNATQTYKTLNVAGMVLYYDFKASGDDKRSLLYSYLILEVKKQALLVLFDDPKTIDQMFAEITPHALKANSYLNFTQLKKVQSRPDIALMCLVKSDNLVVDLELVINSPRFENCINP